MRELLEKWAAVEPERCRPSPEGDPAPGPHVRGLPLGVWDVSDELGRLKKGRVRELLEELAAEGELLASTWEFGERLYRDARRDEAAA